VAQRVGKLEGGEWSAARPGRTYRRERPGTHFTGGWVGSRAGLDGRKISSPPGFDPGPSSPYSVPIPTELPGRYSISITLDIKKVKCTLVQALRICTGHTAHRGSSGVALLFLDHGIRRRCGVGVTHRSLFTPGKDPVPTVQEAGWAQRPVWTGAENLAPTGIRFPDRPACSQSLYRPRYPAHTLDIVCKYSCRCQMKSNLLNTKSSWNRKYDSALLTPQDLFLLTALFLWNTEKLFRITWPQTMNNLQ